MRVVDRFAMVSTSRDIVTSQVNGLDQAEYEGVAADPGARLLLGVSGR
jgi:hypothetical protein